MRLALLIIYLVIIISLVAGGLTTSESELRNATEHHISNSKHNGNKLQGKK